MVHNIERLETQCGSDRECYRITENDPDDVGYVFSFTVQYDDRGADVRANVRSRLERMVSPCMSDSDALDRALREEQALYSILVDQITVSSPLYHTYRSDRNVQWDFINHVSRPTDTRHALSDR
jgi:hypothetical protein